MIMRNQAHKVLLPIATVVGALALTLSAQAQVTSEQQSAIKANCRSDFMAKCSGVTPGGKDALVCLQKNVNGLSAACKSAVSATLPPPAAPKAVEATPAPAPAPAAQSAPQPAATPQPVAVPSAPAPAAPPKAAAAAAPKAAPVAAAPTAAQQNAIKQACRSDFMAKCTGVTPGGKDALTCLQRNAGTLAPACKQAVAAIGGAPAAASATVAATTPAVTAAPAAGPTPQQLKAVKFTCRGDFTRYCRGVQPGGAEAIGCLQSNAARLTPDCKTSLADIADSMPAAASAGAPATAAPTAERRPLPPGITPAGRILRRVMERNQQ